MAENIERKRKRYIWLKFMQDFFHDPKIKKLRRIAGGDTCLCIYLKMMLWSLKNEGIIYYEEIEKTIEDELALILDEDLINIQVLLAFLVAQNLIEIDEVSRDIFMVEVPAVIGKEGDSAQRMRDKRERDRNEQQKLPLSPSDADVTQRKRHTEEKEFKETHTKESFNSIVKFSNSQIEEYLEYKSKDARDQNAYKATMRKALNSNNIDAIESISEYFKMQDKKEVLINSIINQEILFNNYNCLILGLLEDSPSFYFLHLKNLDTNQNFSTTQSMTIEQIKYNFFENKKSLS